MRRRLRPTPTRRPAQRDLARPAAAQRCAPARPRTRLLHAPTRACGRQKKSPARCAAAARQPSTACTLARLVLRALHRDAPITARRAGARPRDLAVSRALMRRRSPGEGLAPSVHSPRALLLAAPAGLSAVPQQRRRSVREISLIAIGGLRWQTSMTLKPAQLQPGASAGTGAGSCAGSGCVLCSIFARDGRVLRYATCCRPPPAALLVCYPTASACGRSSI